jgi:hypothetical protein
MGRDFGLSYPAFVGDFVSFRQFMDVGEAAAVEYERSRCAVCVRIRTRIRYIWWWLLRMGQMINQMLELCALLSPEEGNGLPSLHDSEVSPEVSPPASGKFFTKKNMGILLDVGIAGDLIALWGYSQHKHHDSRDN